MEIRKYHKIVFGLCLGAGLLLGRLVEIQLIDDSYKTASQKNFLVYNDIYPTRGIIYDRNGDILVGNTISYDIMCRPSELEEMDTLLLCSSLDIDIEYVREKIAYYKKWRSRIGRKTTPFMTKVPADTYMKFCEVNYKFPAFSAVARSLREYPVNAGGNLLGYIAEVDSAYIARNPEYLTGDYAGKMGIEAAYEKELRGTKGQHVFIRDSRNRLLEPYNEGANDIPAVSGKGIKTTIDIGLQMYGQRLMKNKIGSVVAIEPETGEILAMVSSPNIDADNLADFGKNYTRLSRDPDKPLFNRTVQASYPPGSVFKLINGLIGLQEGTLTPSQQYPCHNGYYYTQKRKLGCHSHRSPIDLQTAIMMSCNGYFCYVYKNILENPKYPTRKEAYDKWREYAQSFGFGQKLGSDVPYELGGNLPTSDYYDKIYGKKHWGFTNIVSLSIGQGEIGTTPLQIANLSATVANRGWYITPHIIKDSDDMMIDDKYREKHYTMVDEKHFNTVIKGMYKAVNAPQSEGGTAYMGAVPGLDICGKTGTAQNPHGEDHSVFICFAPKDNPKIAIAVYLENAGFGGQWACPIASLMIEKYLNGEISEDRKALEKRMENTVIKPKNKKK